MAKSSKATKKFQKKHLKRTIDHRKEVQKHNKKKASRKSKSSNGHENSTDKNKNEVFDDMPVDEFFEGGFEEMDGKTSEDKNSSKSSEEASDESSEESSGEEDEETMKEELKSLQDKDPEFYRYLKENDDKLLDFEAVNPLDAMSDSDEEEEDVEETEDKPSDEEPASKKASTNKIEVSNELLEEWSKGLSKPSLKLIKNIVAAFKAAVNVNRAVEEDYKYTVTDPSVFNDLMLLGLRGLPESLQKLVKYKLHPQTGARVIPENNPNAKQVANILKSHAASYLVLLNGITNTETAALVLSSLQDIFPYFISHRRLVKEILSSVIRVWSTTTDTQTQIAAFAFLANMSKEFSKSILENVLKLTYSIFLQNCRNTNIHTTPMINFCKNSAAELYGIDKTVSYQVAFEYIRQLAIHLRNSINATSNAKEGYKIIYNWQFCHSLDFWSRILSKHCNTVDEIKTKKKNESPLRELIYPLVQVTLGTIRLIPTAQFFPLRFYLIRSLIRLSQSTGTFIPIFPLLSEILTSTSINKKPKSSNLPAFDFDHKIKANQSYLGTKTFQDGLIEQFLELTAEFFVLYSKSIAYPELVTPAILALRRYSKKSANSKFNKQLQQLIEKLNSNATYISSKREKVKFGPANRTEVQLFLREISWENTPLGQYVVVQRKVKEDKLRLLREALEEEERAKKQENSLSDDNAIDEIESSDSEEESEDQ
ncbi:Piso0_002706 [Millerozyma farinosa CBS 7064]|uniref:Piso0_002706 protein n=1 Tax=Pichia sorbitophila (strain ATCC MYA-4447 / BCRC 22081 / CBS 7064 / NBRC 10061 / NRRL Y-12695) TaxID=559304 RepID=G8YDA9_PICSO|nr:Piso0_002706 [Millerozyma farinosa CBS 7064]